MMNEFFNIVYKIKPCFWSWFREENTDEIDRHEKILKKASAIGPNT